MSSLIVIDPLTTNGAAASQQDASWAPMSPFSDDNAFMLQIDRILQGEELSGSEVLRRLLKFLADKTISGEADELKEYSVAIDGLGKPASYDPRHTSAVRIQAGRLRQKLIDYYRGEGSDDPIVISLPKGHFRLSCRYRTDANASGKTSLQAIEAHDPLDVEDEHIGHRTPIWRRYGLVLWVAIASIALNMYFGARHPWTVKAADPSAMADLSPAMKDLWGPFILSKRPMMLVLEDPLFVEFKTGQGIYYRDKSLHSWSDVPNSPEIAKIRAILKNPSMQPSQYYTAFGEANAAFLIGRFFGARNQNFFSLTRSSDVSASQMAANNILSVGIPRTMFNKQLESMPVRSELLFEPEGIKNLHPRPGELSLYADQFSTAPAEEGVAYALVSHFPGPLRNTEVESFVGNRAAGYVASVQAFLDPDFARNVDAKLRQANGGNLPRYYQVLLKVSFTNSVPTETTCVLVRQVD